MSQNIEISTPKNLLLFDGECNLCNGAVQFVIRRDPKGWIHFAPLQSEPGQIILKKHGLSQTDFDTFVFVKNDRAYTKSSAVLLVAKELGGLWSGFYILMFIPKFFRDWLYGLVAKNRYRIWGRRDSCMMPSPELEGRFLG